MLKVCLLSRYFDLRNAGVGRFSMEMCSGLRERGIQVTTVSTNHSGGRGYFIYSALEMPFRLPRGCSVYHALTPIEAIYLPKGRSVVTFHDLIPWLYLDRVEAHYASGAARRFVAKHYFALASRLASRCRIIACVSEQTKEDVALHLNIRDEAKLRVIRSGVSPQLKPGRKEDGGVFRIGTLSYLDRRKRVDLLIRGFLEANIDAELVIGGDGVDRARLEALAGGDRRIKFLGFVPDSRLAEFYNSLDVFVFPTALEGYGLPIVEAMACKKPVVVLEDARIPEEVKSRCVVVSSLREFLRDPEMNIDVEDNYLFARLHDWKACVEEYVKIYREVQQ